MTTTMPSVQEDQSLTGLVTRETKYFKRVYEHKGPSVYDAKQRATVKAEPQIIKYEW